jgi:hypothetical protein
MHRTKLSRGAVSLALALALAGAASGQPPAEPAAEPPASSTEAPAAASAAPTEGDTKTLAGISILGNQEAPKSLVIVPWKSSEIGSGIGVSRALDPSIRPVDKDVFMRELRYYEIRTGVAN